MRRTFEQRALKRMLEQVDNADEKVEAVCKLMHAYCELIRHDVAISRSRPTSESKRRGPGTKCPDPTVPRIADAAELARTVLDLYGVTLSPDRSDLARRHAEPRQSGTANPADGPVTAGDAGPLAHSRSQSGEI